MKVLTRYILRAHIGPFLFAFVALTGVILINTLARQLASLAGRGLPTDVLLEFFVLSLPANIALTLPMSVLVAVLYTFSQLAAENEIMAMKANGVNLRALMVPLLLVAALITGGMIYFNDQVLPASNHQWRQLMADITQKSPLLVLREQTVNAIPSTDGSTRYFLRAGQVDASTNRLRDVTIYDISDPRVGRTIYADSGRMALNAGMTDLYLTLFDGHVREVNFAEPERFQLLNFQRQALRMSGVGNTLERSEGSEYRGDREMTVAMLQGRIDTLRTELATVHSEQAGSSILPVADRASALRRQIRELQVELQKKYSIAVATLVFVLIGAPLALRFPRGGIGLVIAASLTIFALYYVGLIGGETLGDEGYVSPVWAMWGMNALLGVLGLLALLRLGTERGTMRGGGGWGDWFRSRFSER